MSLEHVSPATRRTFLSLAGGLTLGGLLSACGGDSGGVGTSGGKTISQWYHLYGEAGTQKAVMRYAAAYKPATVKVQWTAGDYTSKLNAGLVSKVGPDVFESTVNIDMVKSKQVVPLDDILQDVTSDYTDADLKSTTVDGKIYGAKIVDDIGLLYYRRSVLDKAGIKPPTTVDELIAAAKALTTPDMKGLFVGNDAGVTPAFGGGALLGPVLWAAGSDYLTADNKPGFTTDQVKQSFTKLQELAASGSLLLGAPTDWWDPSSLTNGLAAMQWCGLWAMPGIKKALGDDFGVVAWPALAPGVGKPSTFLGGWTSMVSAKAKDVDAAKAYTKWLWVDDKADQEDFNLSYGFHIPPRKSLAASAEKLKSGPAADALAIFNQYAVAANPMWTPKMNTAFSDAATAIVRKNGNVDSQLAAAEKAVTSELDRLLG